MSWRATWAVATIGSLVGASVALIVTLVVVPATSGVAVATIYPSPPNPDAVPISHLVILMMENRPYDNYFGTYCLVTGPSCSEVGDGLPAGTCVPLDPLNPASGCVRPFPAATTSQNLSVPDLPHGWQASNLAYDSARMDGFFPAEGSTIEPFGYYTGANLPAYWNLAEEYLLGDNFFASTLSYSLPNHWDLLAGQAPTVSEYYGMDTGANGSPLTSVQRTYLDEANGTRSIADLLVNSTATWSYFDDAPPGNYSTAIFHHGHGGAFEYWNPLLAKAETYGPVFLNHFASRETFFNDTRNGSLPSVSWVIPTYFASDHPPANLATGEAFVLKVVGAVENSTLWNSTALFVTWDDYGGFYDHQAPPALDRWGLSFRAPLLVISPYTPVDAIGHEFGYFESLLRFIEWRFHLASLNTRDAAAPLPLGYFDFRAAPRPPLAFGSPAWARYPQPMQTAAPPGLVTGISATAGSGSVTLQWTPPVGGSAVGGYRLSYGPLLAPNESTVYLDGSASGVTLSGLRGGLEYRFTLVPFAGPALSSPATLTATPNAPSFVETLEGPVGYGLLTFGVLLVGAVWSGVKFRRAPAHLEPGRR